MTPTSGRMARRSGSGTRRLVVRTAGPRRRADATGPRWEAGQGQRLGLVEYLALELPQLLARLEAELVDERRPDTAVGGQGVRLAPAPVEGDHQLGPEPLAQRMDGHQALELGHTWA